MKTNRLHIAIIVQSKIVYEGLHTLISQSDLDVKISKLDALDDLEQMLLSDPINVLIVNPILIANRDKDIKKIRKTHPNLSIIGVNIGLIDNSLTQLTDDSFGLFDADEQIINKLRKASHDNESQAQTENLTERELEVLSCLVHGLSNKEIAEALNISIHTVITHRKNITTKTGIRSQSGLTIYAISKKIIDIDEGFDELIN